MQCQVRFNKDGSGEGLGSFWCRGRVEQGSIKRFRRRSWCRARSGSTGFRRRLEALAKSRVRFDTVPEKVPEKVWEALVQPGHPEGSWRRSWCRARSGSTDRVPEKVPKKVSGSLGAKPSQVQWVPEKAWEALGHSQVRFNRVSEKVLEKVPEKVWEALVQSQVRFNRVPEKVPDKVPGSFGAEPGQVQQGSGEGFGEGLGGFGAGPGQVQQGSAEYSGEGSRKPWRQVRFNGFRGRLQKPSQVRFI